MSIMPLGSRRLKQALLAVLEGANDKDLPERLRTGLGKLSTAYSKYCVGIPAAQELYEKKLGQKEFRDFEASFKTLSKPTLNYIMRPVQVCMILFA